MYVYDDIIHEFSHTGKCVKEIEGEIERTRMDGLTEGNGLEASSEAWELGAKEDYNYSSVRHITRTICPRPASRSHLGLFS